MYTDYSVTECGPLSKDTHIRVQSHFEFRVVFALSQVRMSSIHCMDRCWPPSTDLHLQYVPPGHRQGMYTRVAMLLLRIAAT